MRTYAAMFAVVSVLIGSGPAGATYDVKKLNDWKYHAFICKQVVMNLSVLVGLEERYGREKVAASAGSIKESIAGSVLEFEKKYPFDSTDAMLIADMTFSVREGLHAGGFALNDHTAMSAGFDLCASSLESFDEQLTKKEQ